MFRFLRDVYLTAFTLAFRFRAPPKYGGGWGPVFDAGKGAVFVSLILALSAVGIEQYVQILIRKRFFDSYRSDTVLAVAFFFFLYFANYYVLITRRHGIEFERAFSHFRKSRKVLLTITCALLVLAWAWFITQSRSAYFTFFHM